MEVWFAAGVMGLGALRVLLTGLVLEAALGSGEETPAALAEFTRTSPAQAQAPRVGSGRTDLDRFALVIIASVGSITSLGCRVGESAERLRLHDDLLKDYDPDQVLD